MKYKFTDLVDISKLQKLMEDFYSVTGILLAVSDVEGNILIAVGWHDICTKFHRVNPETEALCKQSDKYLEDHLNIGKPYISYKCANGLIDVAAPIIIDGVHLASIYHGQFFFEKPDVEKFRLRAQKYGFDEKRYLEALAKVPVRSKDDLDAIMNYLSHLADMLAQMGIVQLKTLESKKKALRESEERLQIIFDNTPNIAFRSYDLNRNLLYWNKTFESLFRWTPEELKGKNVDELFSNADPKDVKVFLAMLKKAEKMNKLVGPIERTFKNNKGNEVTVYTTIFPIESSEGKKEFICKDVDITEVKRLEKEMVRMDQLNLVGEMAASIGHEVRNPMTTVRGFLQMMEEKGDCRKYKNYFNLMIEELDRANSIITEFLSLAKNKIVRLRRENLNDIIKALSPLIKANSNGFNQHLKLELGEIPELLLDEKEIRQLILNLSRNAMEAMDSGGSLTIKTYVEKETAVLTVQDEGCGIPVQFIDKLGAPFLSTKESGTGLGLAVCYSIIARHQASISVESGDEGTNFFIRFTR